MRRFLPADMLARPDHLIVMSVRKMCAIRAEQGLTGVIVPLDEEHLRARPSGADHRFGSSCHPAAPRSALVLR
jgi:hypothetical protein